MTVVIGYVDNEEIVFGADTCLTFSDYTLSRVADKVHVIKVPIKVEGSSKRGRKPQSSCREEEMLLGYAGSVGLLQSIRHNVIMPTYEEGYDLMDYMVQSVVPVFRELMDTSDENTKCISVLIGFKGKLFEIDEGLNVTENFRPYYCIGTGLKHAQAYLYAVENMSIPTEEKVRGALECASEFVVNVKPPFTFHKIKI